MTTRAKAGRKVRIPGDKVTTVTDDVIEALDARHHPSHRLSYKPNRDTYRCISFDGGPNTLTYLRCLLEIEKRCPGFSDRTDVFAGTSDGAFATAYFATKAHIGEAEILECIAMIEEILSEAIAPNHAKGVQRAAARLANTLGLASVKAVEERLDSPLRVVSALAGMTRLISGVSTWADQDTIRAILERYIDPTGKLSMGDAPRDAVIVSYAVHAQGPIDHHGKQRYVQRPKVFQSIDRGDKDATQTLIEVALRSAAMPLFLPIHDRHVDGAVFANNPAMCAVAAAVAKHRTNDGDGLWYLKDLVVLSMGADDSGFGSDRVTRELDDGKEHRWGWGKWLLYGLFDGFKDLMLIMDVVLNSDSSGVNYQAGQLLGRRYLRIAPPGPTRTVDKFAGILLGQVAEFKQMAVATARTWAAESDAIADQGGGRGRDGEGGKDKGDNGDDDNDGDDDVDNRDEARRRLRAQIQAYRDRGQALSEGDVPLYGTRSLAEAIQWAKSCWMPGPRRSQGRGAQRQRD